MRGGGWGGAGFAVCLGVVGCGVPSEPPNASPDVRVEFAPAVVSVGEGFQVVASVRDPDHPIEALTLRLTGGGLQPLSPVIDTDRLARFTIPAGLEGSSTLLVTASDPMGASAAAEVGVEVGAGTFPTADINDPTSGASSTRGQCLSLSGMASDPEVAPERLEVAWLSSIDGELVRGWAGTSGETQHEECLLSTGEHEIRLLVTDPAGNSTADGILVTVCEDGDGDGAGACGGDCDDENPTRGPHMEELCDGVDNDCDGVTPVEELDLDADGYRVCDGDCADDDPGIGPGQFDDCDGIDSDCDGVVDGAVADSDLDGVLDCWDCEPFSAASYPGGSEICDGLDNDCDGSVDEGLGPDGDGDGWFPPGACGPTGDCDDGDPAVYPTAPELCDGLDNDCDGVVDDGLDFTDADGDGFVVLGGCGGADCDDSDPLVNPGGFETCDGIDEDCDGSIDEGLGLDGDGDGYDSPGACVTTPVDCDDTDPESWPGAPEVCDGADNDCDGGTDEGLSVDADGDGVYSLGSCFQPNEDCDDTDSTVPPGCPSSFPSSWVRPGGDAGGTGYVAGLWGARSLVLDWELEVPVEDGAAPLLIGEGRVYTVESGVVRARSLDDGTLVWEDTTRGGPRASSLLSGGSLVYPSSDLTALDASTGAVLWSVNSSSTWDSDPTSSTGLVWQKAGTQLVAWDAQTGSQISATTVAWGNWSPVWDGATSIYGRASTGALGQFDVAGTLLGTITTTQPSGAEFLVAAEGLLADVAAGDLMVADPTTGAELWSTTTFGAFNWRPAVANGTIYAAAQGHVEAYDLLTGAYLGAFVGPETLFGSLVVTDDVVIAGGLSGTYVFDLTTWALIDQVASAGRIALGKDKLIITKGWMPAPSITAFNLAP